MRSECLPLDVIPHLTKLFKDHQAEAAAVKPFYSKLAPSGNVASLRDYPQERRCRVADVLLRQNQQWQASDATMKNIGRLGVGASAIVTGQQVALFGGPMYAVLKALTAIKEAGKATRAGNDCVPIFWLASEDHDLAEVSSVTLLT